MSNRANFSKYYLRDVPGPGYYRDEERYRDERRLEEQRMEQLAEALASLTRFQQEQQQRMEENRQHEEEVRRKQYEEHQEQVRTMHDQHMEQMRVMEEALQHRPSNNDKHFKMAPYQEKEDIQDFIDAFEGIMHLQEFAEEEWVLRLTPLLSGKARTVCTDIGPEMGYAAVKRAILDHYSINPERSRRDFRALVWTKDQEPTEWILKGMKLAKRWLLPEGGADQMLHKIAVEQFINGLPQELRLWVASHTPETPAQVAQLIESYESAHSSKPNRPGDNGKPRYNGTEYKNLPRKTTSSRDLPRSWRRSEDGRRDKRPISEIVCYKCNRKGHYARNCTEKTLHVQERTNQIQLFGEGEVNGQPVKRIQIDSGASRTVIDRKLIKAEDIWKDSIFVTFGNGTAGEYPLADVNVKFDGEEYQVVAAVVQDLAEDVLLGRDVPLHKHMVKRLSEEEQISLIHQLARDNKIELEIKDKDKAFAVSTRSQTRRKHHQVGGQQEGAEYHQEGQQHQQREELHQEGAEGHQNEEHRGYQEEELGQTEEQGEEKQHEERYYQEGEPYEAQHHQREEQYQKEHPEEQYQGDQQEKRHEGGRQHQEDRKDLLWEAGEEFQFEEDLFGGEKNPKIPMTREEKRRHNRRWTDQHRNGITTSSLREEQKKDPKIKKWMLQEDATRIKRNNGILCRTWRPRNSTVTYEQIVLPEQYHRRVIEIAHDIPLAGHLGREKTTQRILRRFYWPTIFQDVRNYCQTCKECQLHGGSRHKAPMIPLPIIGEPFRRIAMDIVGPLPRTSRGNKFILVISDYATRYPEAFALRNITAPKIAEVLMELFTRHGIPEEILTDQGTNFTSKLLEELYKLVGIKAIRTSPYHPQTDGLVERLNKTLKSMLRKVLDGKKRDWDRLLPYILFAYREVPQATLGFSPFELLYGRDVRGPLDVLCEDWIQNPDVDTDILTHVMEVRARMQEAKDIVEQNAKIAQKKQKEYYDQKAREMNLQQSDEVLLLLPSSTKKFVAQWQGPYRVIRRIGKVNYEIEMPDKGGRKQIFHVNHLRKWHDRVCQVNAVIEDGDGIEEYQWSNKHPMHLGCHLSPDQRRELQQLIRAFPQVTKETPGRTHRIFHKIRTTDNIPVRQKPYRIPQAYREQVMKELEDMEKAGIIQKSESEWASPLVIVKKKDGGLRLCVDYRKLNQITKFDAYPMPRIEELLDSIGNAKFITTLDLSKGYWQVPMKKEDQEKTAFTTPKGLYQFTTMPFGLSGAPATFQRMMDEVLRGTDTFAGVYLDDIVIHSSNWKEHCRHLEEILKRLSDAGLTLKLEKCVFAAVDCTYLGYKIGKGGVRPEESKVQAVVSMTRPKTKKDVRTFLGMTGYYRRFVRNYAMVAEPLTELTKKNLPEQVCWDDKTELAFQRLKEMLVSAPLMRNPDFTRTFILQTDASGTGVGAVLSQGEEEDRPIAYFSRKLLHRERAYSTVEKECLAIVLAIKHFRPYLLGRSFVVQTDHRALRWLHQFRERNTRLTRWSLLLQPYIFIVQHRKGRNNANADALSRLELDTLSPHFVPGEEGGNVMD